MCTSGESVTELPSLGWGRPAASAGTASAGGKRCASSSRTAATPSTGPSPSTRSPPPRYVVPVPEGVSSLDAAPLACAGVTTYKAAKVADIMPTHLVAVFGVGGLGHLAVQYAHIMGGSVVAVDLDQAKLDLAIELGADHVVNARETDPVAAIQALGGADVAFALAVAPAAFEQAFNSLRRGGKLLCVALPPDASMTIPIFDTVLSQGDLDHRLDRRHPPGPGGGLRPARRRANQGRRHRTQAQRRQRSHRRSPLRDRRRAHRLRILNPHPSALGGSGCQQPSRPDPPSTRTSHATGDLDAAHPVPTSRRCLGRAGRFPQPVTQIPRPARVPRDRPRRTL